MSCRWARIAFGVLLLAYTPQAHAQIKRLDQFPAAAALSDTDIAWVEQGGVLPARQVPLSYLRSYLRGAPVSATATVPIARASTGVNLAGAEFGSNYPGTFGTDYTYATSSELDYYKSKGLMLIRVPFLWERMQPTLNTALNTAELGRMQTLVAAAASRGMKIVLDAHNYGRYGLGTFSDPTTHGNIIGSSQVPVAAFSDFWTRMATAFAGNPGVYGYDLTNEPHDMGGASVWPTAAQAAINAIRTVDTTTPIIVEGDLFSSAQFWASTNTTFPLSDSSNNLLYEAHQYFDGNSSGQYTQTYDAQGAYPTIGVDRVTPFLNWLSSNHVRGYLGEYGVPNNDARWFTVLDNFLNAITGVGGVPGTYWAGGPSWNWCNSLLVVEPCNCNDAPQMPTLVKYATQPANQSRLDQMGNAATLSDTDLLITHQAGSPSQGAQIPLGALKFYFANTGAFVPQAALIKGSQFLVGGATPNFLAGP